MRILPVTATWIALCALATTIGCRPPTDGEQPVDVQPVDVQPVDVQPVDVQPVDVQPVDVQPVDVPPTDPPRAADTSSPSWPRFHGSDGTNIAPETGLARQWPEGGPPLLWQCDGLGHGFSSVSLADGWIFVDGNLEEQTTVTAMDLEGEIAWQQPVGRAWTKEDLFPGSRGTPTFDQGRIYHETPLGDVVCLEAATGDVVWQVNILERFVAEMPKWALAESVLVDGDRVLCTPGGDKASMVALDKKTGETVWAAESTGEPTGYCSPVIVEHQGRRIALVMTGKSLIGVDADSGKLLFHHPHETKYDINVAIPIYQDGRIFISSGYRSGSEMLRLVEPEGDDEEDALAVEVVWTSKELDNHHGGVILVDGYLYGAAHGANRGNWICLDWETGQMQYSEEGVGKGSATLADGLLFVMSEKHAVGLVPAVSTSHEVVSRFELPLEGSSSSWAHPVVCDGRLYLRYEGTVLAYDVRE